MNQCEHWTRPISVVAQGMVLAHFLKQVKAVCAINHEFYLTVTVC